MYDLILFTIFKSSIVYKSKPTMKKTIVIVTIVLFITTSYAFMRDDPPRYENLKILPKNTTKQEMDSIMKHFSRSLGVKCSFCHVRNNDEKKDFNFASDESKNKLIARNMIKMMNKINKKYIKEDNEEHRNKGNMIPVVSCYSCHHGHEDPENRPPAPPPGGPQQAGPGQQQRP